jgi:hypothetical protein
MLMQRRFCMLAVLCLAVLAAPISRTMAQGTSPDKYFPEGADSVIQLNLNQLMGSKLLHQGIPLLVSKYGESVLKMATPFIPDDNPAKGMLEGLGPTLKEVVTEDKVTEGMTNAKMFLGNFTFALNSKEEVGGVPNFVMSLTSPMLQASMVEQFVPMMEQSGQVEVKTETVDGITVHEIKPKQSPMAFHMAVPEDGVIVFSVSKDVLVKTVKNKGKNQVDPKLKELLTQRKNTYTLFMAALAPKNKADEFKHFVANLTLDNNVNGNVNVVCANEEAAKAKAKEANESFEGAVATIVGFADDHPELKPLSDSLKKVKAEVSGSNITMKMSVNGDELIKAMKAAK